MTNNTSEPGGSVRFVMQILKEHGQNTMGCICRQRNKLVLANESRENFNGPQQNDSSGFLCATTACVSDSFTKKFYNHQFHCVLICWLTLSLVVQCFGLTAWWGFINIDFTIAEDKKKLNVCYFSFTVRWHKLVNSVCVWRYEMIKLTMQSKGCKDATVDLIVSWSEYHWLFIINHFNHCERDHI